MKLTQRRTLALLAGLALSLAGCGDSGAGGPSFTVAFVHPAEADTVYVGQTTALEVEVLPVDGADLDGASFEFDWEFGDGVASTGLGPAVDYVYAQPGTIVVRVVARMVRGGRSVDEARAQRSVFVHPAPDLSVDGAALTVSSAVVRSGDTFRLSGNLLSLAAEAPSPFDVGFYVGLPSELEGDPIDAARLRDLLSAGLVFEVGRIGFPSLAAQPAQAVIDDASLTMPEGAPSREYAAFMFVDPDGIVGETDEENNLAVAERRLRFENSSGEGPDLATSGVAVRPTLANSLGSISLSVTISNAGNVFADPFGYAVYLSADNPTLDEEDRVLLTGAVDNLPAGQDFRLTDLAIALDPPVTELGNYFVLVQADSADQVAETNEDNNVAASPRITVTDVEVPGADIVPTAFAVLPATTYIGGSMQIDLTVANQGDSPVDRQFNCKFYFSEDAVFDPNVDPLVQTMLIQPLAAGEERAETMDAFVPPVAPGEYLPIAACDPSLLIPESDDDNNILVASSPIVVAAEANVDLAPSALSVSPLQVANGDPVAVSVDVCNDGSNGSTPSVVRVFISPDGTLDTDDTVLLESRVPPIDAGLCITIAASVPADCDTFVSEYEVFAVVDVTGLVAEVDESNNVAQLGDTLEITSLICACEPDEFEPNDSPFVAGFLNPDLGHYDDLTMCTQNVDYYYLPLLRDETVRVTIDFDHDHGDLDMQLFAIDRSTVLDESASVGDREEVSYLRVPERGNYLLRVRGKTESDRNVYSLDIEVSAPVVGTDLIVLDVSVDEERPVLGESVEVCFDIVNLGGSPAGPSLARVYLSEDTALDPLADPLVGDLVIDGFDARIYRCVEVVIPEDSGGGPRYLVVVADARDDVTGELSETNNVGVSPVVFVDDACFDVLEPNNVATEPRRLTIVGEPPVTLSSLLVCSANLDFYELCVSDGDFLSVTANFDPTDGDLDMKLWQGANEVDRSEGVGASENVSVDYVAGDRCYTVEIYVAGLNREVPYELVVDTGPAPESLACSRIEEPNDDFATALPLRDFLDDCPAVCPTDDEDYYRLELTPGTEVSFELFGADGAAPPAELRMTLYGPFRNFLTNTVTATEVMDYTASLTGTHYLRVRSNGDGPRNQQYCIVAEGLSGTDLVPSNLSLDTGVAAPGQTVRFSFELANTRDVESVASTYAVYLSRDPVISGDDRLLREVALAPLGGLSERIEGRRFDVPTDLVAGGDFYVVLLVDNGNAVAEFNEVNNVLVTPLVVTPRCLPDAAEPNDYPIDAAPAGDFAGELLSSCGRGDVDWFVHTATATETTFTITFADADGDLDLAVYGESEGGLTLLGVSDSITDDELVTVPTEIGLRYFVEVGQYTDRSAPYVLSVE